FDPAAPDYDETERQIIARETRRGLLQALDKLSERERRIIELRYWGEQDTRTIAEILSMSESNVRVTLHRTLGKLKNILGDM
ncbi:MAG: sigma-70 family RNA polymerase sigma factor, partial [Selenomonadaceae bacterium]|nr:sigma-70 family RNA polymerase sigma factor [Selenomonadaceae bacterium]